MISSALLYILGCPCLSRYLSRFNRLFVLGIFLQLNEEDYDQEILDLILDRGLVGRLAGTALYGPLCERLLSSSDPTLVEDVARQLVDHGHRSQAGHLLELTSGLPRYLLNLSTSLYFTRKKLL